VSNFQTIVDLRPDGIPAVVEITAGLDRVTRELTVSFTALDPSTGWLPNGPMVGLLYPDDSTGRGEGLVSYQVASMAGLPSGTVIQNEASIVFDYNDPINTPLVKNTLDAGPPTSHVDPLPATSTDTTLHLSWSGQDDPGGSGIASYDIYAAMDGSAPFVVLQDMTTTSGSVVVEPGHTYSFYSIATDNVGHVEPTPSTPEATTFVAGPPTSSVNALPPTTTTASFTVSWSGTPGPGASSIASYEIFVSEDGGPFTPFLNGTSDTSATFIGQLGHTYGFYSVATNNLGLVQPAPTAAQAMTTLRVPPATPSAPTLLPADSNGSRGGETTYLTSPYLTGTTIAGGTVQLLNTTGKVLNTTKASTTGAYQIQVPGPLKVGKYSFRVDVVDQYGDISSPSAATTITVVNPPAPAVKKTSLTTSKGSIDAITVYFSEAITTASADNRKSYTLVDAGSSHVFGGKGNTKVTIKTASYNGSSHSVKLTLAKPVSTGDSLRLTINAQPPSGIKGTNGQYLNETAIGKAGANAVIYLGAPRKKQTKATAIVRTDLAKYGMLGSAGDKRTQTHRGIPHELPARRDWQAVWHRGSVSALPSHDDEKLYRTRTDAALAAIDELLEREEFYREEREER
jgi:hypothetical protein